MCNYLILISLSLKPSKNSGSHAHYACVGTVFRPRFEKIAMTQTVVIVSYVEILYWHLKMREESLPSN